jgi:CRP-like cAMP-binding protein
VSAATILSGLELFADLTPEDLDVLWTHVNTLRLARNDVVFAEGAEAGSMFVVQDGRVAIANRSFDGRESMVAIMGSGDMFGEMSLFDGQGRSAEARALEKTVVLEIPYQPLKDIWTREPEHLWRVATLLTRRIRAMDAALADAVFLDVTGRTAKHLLEYAGDQSDFELPITQEELARRVGASRERVNKAIASFMKLGWLEPHGAGYRILDRRQLEIRSM